MHRIRILPKLALNSMKKSLSSYLPYTFATAFSVFVFFIFSAISDNAIMQTMPHAGYLLMLMEVGKVLLGLILVPFLFYTNSFLMKRRKRELGLYSILGLEKKHIGVIIGAETVVVYCASLILGIVMALVFSKLIFLLLLNMAQLPVDVQFTASPSSYGVTAIFFGAIFLLNLFINMVKVSRAKPADLFQSARQGEKQPKHLWPATLLGVASLGGGYYIAANFHLHSNFILDFFLAVTLVIVGTYCLFTSGIVVFLRLLKRNRRYYYSKRNFVTVSGMLYRMRKNAASLSNICVFSTMIIITLVCTVSLFKGLGSIVDYRYPYDVNLRFINSEFDQREELQEKIIAEAASQNITVENAIAYEYAGISVERNGNDFQEATENTDINKEYTLRLLILEDYNRIAHAQETLSGDEVLFFTTGKDEGFNSIWVSGRDYAVKKELQSLSLESKEPEGYDTIYYLVVPDKETVLTLFPALLANQQIYSVRFDLNGEQPGKEAFVENLNSWVSNLPGISRYEDRITGEQEESSLLGGLLFLGIFFGIIFMVCMIMIMYYKQVAEGYEDKTNFDVMQQVGMSSFEVRATIRRQILTVFFLPLVTAILHTGVALKVIEVLLSTLNLFNHNLILLCTAGVCASFALVYIVSYHLTAKAYYRIVRR